jgi:soluble lytic murein transglycosylase
LLATSGRAWVGALAIVLTVVSLGPARLGAQDAAVGTAEPGRIGVGEESSSGGIFVQHRDRGARGMADPLAGVAALVRGGDPAAALAALDALPPAARALAEARYLRGRLLEDLRRPDEATAEYQAALDAAAVPAVPGEAPAPPSPSRSSPASQTVLPDAVRDDAVRRRALALARAGRCAEAAPLLAALPSRTAEVESQAAACARAAGDLDAALAFARAALRRAGERAIAERLALADVLEARGDRPAAARELRALATLRPDHAKDRLVLTRLGRLEGTGDTPRLSDDERLARAEKLLAARQHARCLDELAALSGRAAFREGPSPGGARAGARLPPRAPRRGRADQDARAALARLLHLEGMCLFGTRARHLEAARVLERAAALGGPTAAADLLHAARSLARADQDARAIALYDRVVRGFPATPEAGEAEYRAAALAVSLRTRDAERRLRAFLGLPGAARRRSGRPTQGPEADHVRAARALLGFLALDAGKPRDAHAAFVALAESGTGGLVRGRGSYWAGRAAEAAGDRAEAVRRYRDTIALEPLHWYALLSAARLRALGEDPGPPVPPASSEVAATRPVAASGSATHPSSGVSPDSGTSPGPSRSRNLAAVFTAPSDLAELALRALPDAARFYARLGLHPDAIAALRGAEDALRRAAPSGRADELLAEAHALVGDFHGAYRIAARHTAALAREPTAATAWVWRHAYPLAYAELVEAETRARGLPRGYLWAVMRQESGYDPRVVSRADAIGLLQVLPSTGEGIARAEGIRGYSRERLFEPAFNVRLAARHHQNLLADYGGRLPLAIAAYNAGSGRVDRWLRTIPHRDLDRFVESIPIDETRNYVRRVISHLARYTWIAALTEGAPSDAWPQVPLPDRL